MAFGGRGPLRATIATITAIATIAGAAPAGITYGGSDRSAGESRQSARGDDRDLDRLFPSEGARQVELDRLSEADQRRYESATPNEHRRWDDEFADNARQRWPRMSDNERRRYVDEVQRVDRGERRMSETSSDDRRR